MNNGVRGLVALAMLLTAKKLKDVVAVMEAYQRMEANNEI